MTTRISINVCILYIYLYKKRYPLKLNRRYLEMDVNKMGGLTPYAIGKKPDGASDKLIMMFFLTV